MSSMLEQAIIDAAALKEAALKNAEQEVLERYSKDIKEAVDALLEQDDEFGLDPEEQPDGMSLPPLDGVGSPEEEPIVNDIPSAATGGEKLCPCDPDDEEMEINLTDLMMQPDEGLPGNNPSNEEPPVSRAEIFDDIEDPELREMVQEALKDLKEEEAEELEEGKEEEAEELEEGEIELDEQELVDIVEELVFDYKSKPTGWASGHPKQQLEQEQMVSAFAKEVAEANKKNKDLKESLKESRSENNKLRRIALQLKEKLDEVSASNARLIYTNRVMGNDSLNERQKKKIVEKISQAQTIEEAKTIHEALQSAVVGTPKSKGPKSLNEAVSRQSTQVFSRRQRSEGTRANDQFFSRMQRLAGIKN